MKLHRYEIRLPLTYNDGRKVKAAKFLRPTKTFVKRSAALLSIRRSFMAFGYIKEPPIETSALASVLMSKILAKIAASLKATKSF
jgi:hypothetical protein